MGEAQVMERKQGAGIAMMTRFSLRLVLMMTVSLVALSGCQVFGGGDGDDDTSADSGGNNTSVIRWDRDPSNVVFRAEVTAGADAEEFYRQNEVPLCTIYGDGRVIWMIEDRGTSQVLFDVLTDEQIVRFVDNLTVQQEIYNYEAAADVQVPSSEVPAIEQLTLHVNDVVQVTDAFDDWDIDFFENILNSCQTISETPTIYEPAGAWVSAELATYDDSGAPVVLWDPEAAGLSIAELAEGEPRWLTNQTMRILWNLIRTSTPDLLISEGANTYQIAVQVPNVTVDAPPAPDE